MGDRTDQSIQKVQVTIERKAHQGDVVGFPDHDQALGKGPCELDKKKKIYETRKVWGLDEVPELCGVQVR